MKNLMVIFFASFLALQGTSFSQVAVEIPFDRSVLSDQSFRKQFTYDFAPRTEVEPKISPEERELIGKINVDRPRESLALLQPAITGTSSAALHFLVGHLEKSLNQNERARTSYEQAIRKFPNFLRAHLQLGILYMMEDKFDKAAPYLQKAVVLGEKSSQIFGMLGQCYRQADQMIAAEAAYRSAFLLDPDRGTWRLNLIDALRQMERWEEANGLIAPLLAEEPDNVNYWILQANCFIGMEQNSRAAENFEVVRRMGKASSEVLNQLGLIYLSKEQPGAALSAYMEALKVSKKIDGSVSIRTARLLVQQGAFQQAEIYLKKVRGAGAALSEADKNELKVLQAKVAQNKGDLAQAIKLLKSVQGLSGEALIALGNIHGERAQALDGEDKTLELSRAELYFGQAESLPEVQAEACLRHARVLVQNQDYVKASGLLERSLKLRPLDNVKEYFRRVERAAKRQETQQRRSLQQRVRKNNA